MHYVKYCAMSVITASWQHTKYVSVFALCSTLKGFMNILADILLFYNILRSKVTWTWGSMVPYIHVQLKKNAAIF
jgi:hypothetical protein